MKLDFTEVTKWLIKLHNKVFITVIVMSIKILPLVVIVSRNIKFNIVQKLAIRKKTTVKGVIYSIIARYRKGGLHINTLLMDQEFNEINADIINQKINVNP